MYAGSGAFGFVGVIEFDWVDDPKAVARDFIRAAAEVEDMQAPLRLSEQIAIEDMRERFDTQTTPDGVPWKEWSLNYAPVARSTNLGEILEQYFGLRNAATSPSAYMVSQDSVFFDVGALPEYGIWHQEGRSRGVRGSDDESRAENEAFLRDNPDIDASFLSGINILPARPFIGPSIEAQLQIVQVFDQWYAGIYNIITTGSGRVGRRYAFRGDRGQFSRFEQ